MNTKKCFQNNKKKNPALFDKAGNKFYTIIKVFFNLCKVFHN